MATDYSETKIMFRISGPLPNIRPRWNGCSTQDFGVVRFDKRTGDNTLESMRWGLLPSWAKDDKIDFSTINARAETITEKPTYAPIWNAGNRCVIPVDGFYEWERITPKEKQPYLFSRNDQQLMALAGLWTSKKGEGGELVKSFTIITTAANGFLATIHDRMPVILDLDEVPLWLGEDRAPEEEIAALMRPCPSAWLTKVPIDRRMSNVRNQEEEFCQPLPSATS